MLFTEREKQIYELPSGARYDPVALNHALIHASGGKLDEWLGLWWGDDTEDQDRAAAALRLAQAARMAFKFKPFDEPGGVLDAVVLESLYEFVEWLGKKE